MATFAGSFSEKKKEETEDLTVQIQKVGVALKLKIS